MYETVLESLGLTQNESKVYEALLVLGKAKTGAIVKKAKIASEIMNFMRLNIIYLPLMIPNFISINFTRSIKSSNSILLITSRS